jgi:heat shock protein HtpX
MDPPAWARGRSTVRTGLQGIRLGGASLAALPLRKFPANRFGGFGKMSCMARTSSFGKDTGLQARMLVTMFLLGALYAALVAALFASGASGITILLVAGGLLALQLFTSDKIALRAMGVHEVSPQQAPELHAMIERLCIQADLPKPRIGVMESRMPNAFAMGRSKKAATVCATTGIMELLSPAELEGVMAHELSHIANRDVAIMTMASFFASLASMIVQFGFFFGGGGDNDDDSPGILGLIAISMIVYVISFFLLQALSRYREFAADRGSAIITGRPSALASALLKIAGTMERVPQQDLRAHPEMNAFYIFPAGAKQSLFNLFSTHPPLEKRIAALQRLEGQLQQGGGAALTPA